MTVVQVRFAPWDKEYSFSAADGQLSPGDYVLVRTDLGPELGKVTAIDDQAAASLAGGELKPILRKAAFDDLASVPDAQASEAAVAAFERLAASHNLAVKPLAVHFSLDGRRCNFAFTSPGRVDFRELVKELAAEIKLNVRLTQVGPREAARLSGDCGVCGRGLCCQYRDRRPSLIEAEMAEVRSRRNRGGEKLTGMCGRLMCCLAYEDGGRERAGSAGPGCRR